MRFTLIALIILQYICIIKALTSLKCRYKLLSGIYTCEMRNQLYKIADDPVNVTGSHRPLYNNSKVESLDVTGRFVYIPVPIFNDFTNLKSLQMPGVGMKQLEKNSINNCLSLTKLILSNNQFENLTAEIFSNCGNLLELELNNCRITKIDDNAFKGLVKLSQLSLAYNELTTLNPSAFQELTSLISLSLNDNTISLSMNPFKYLTNLEILDIENNKLTSISGDFFSTNQNLEKLILRNNKIIAINRNLFDYWPNGASLYLYGNLCINSGYESVGSLTSVESILPDFETCFHNTDPRSIDCCPSAAECRFFLTPENKYICVLNGIQFCMKIIIGDHLMGYDANSVTEVHYINSEIYNIPKTLFDTFGNLEVLSVRNSKMRFLNENTFEACGTKLISFDASYNEISTLGTNALEKCTNLEKLDLHGNLINYFDRKIFEINPFLNEVIL